MIERIKVWLEEAGSLVIERIKVWLETEEEWLARWDTEWTKS